jgi:tripartite-type tricarboxylate transporter receptor subunit TctC
MNHRVLACAVGLLAAASLPFQSAQAQDFPSRPVKMIIPYAPGGSTDVLGRILGVKLGARLGQPVVVENRAGANGAIGTEAVARSAPDGYTILMLTNGQTIAQVLTPGLSWDLTKDFAPIVNIAGMPNVVVVHPSFPGNTLKDLIDAAKANPGKMTYSHPGVGSPQHLAFEMLKHVAKINVVGVPYKGGGPAIADLMAGHVSTSNAGVPNVKGHITAGRLKPLAITGLKRTPALPDLPTVDESGYKGFDAIFWVALLAPKGTPDAVVKRINADANAVLAEQETSVKFLELGATPVGGTPAELAAYIKKDMEMWKDVIKAANITAQ